MEAIQYKLETFEGPLDLLLTLVEKNKMNIEDVPIDLLCEQYMETIRDMTEHNVDLACEFLLMASELMLIKSRMLLPRDPVHDEDPRKPLIDAMLEYQRAKMAANELSDLYGVFSGRLIKEQDDISPDRTFVSEHSIDLLTAALVHVYTETAGFQEKAASETLEHIVHAPRIPVEEIISSLIDRLRQKPLYLDDYFRDSAARSEMIAKFLSILELLKSHIVALEEDDDVPADDSGVTDMRIHAKLTLSASDEDIRAAALDTYA